MKTHEDHVQLRDDDVLVVAFVTDQGAVWAARRVAVAFRGLWLVARLIGPDGVIEAFVLELAEDQVQTVIVVEVGLQTWPHAVDAVEVQTRCADTEGVKALVR